MKKNIKTYKGEKYCDMIPQVHYEMLCGNSSIANYGDLLTKPLA